MAKKKVKKAKIDCSPLFQRGDKFVIVNKNYDPNLMPIEAKRLKDKQVYGFDEDELE